MSAKIRSFDDFLTLFPESPRGKIRNGWNVICPAHSDREPSLSVTLKESTILVKCQAGCKTEDVLQLKGLTLTDLFLNSHKAKPRQRLIEAIYHYTDANGKPFEVVRTRPKGFYQRRPDGKGGYINDLEGIVPTLYHQDRLKQAIDSAKPVYFVEGEKDADRLWGLGLVATTNPMGAGKWRNNYSEALRGAALIIIPDNDAPGREHANHVAKSCYGIAGRMHLLELPSQCKDVSDWLDKGGAREELERLASEASEWTPQNSQTGEAVTLVCMADVEAESVSWLWCPYIPQSKLTLLEGDPGVGKSWVSLAIATAVSLGKGLPGTEASEPQKVLLASAEDGPGDTIRPRLDGMQANVRNVHAIKGALDFGNGGLAILEGYIDHVRPALVILDPLVAYIGAGVDIHRANETRAVMAKLADMAEKHGCAILAIRHLTKGGTLKPIYRGLGSIDFAAACRSVLMAGCDPDNPQKRGIVQIKSNLAPMGHAIGFELRNSSFYWTGESDLTWQRILSAEDMGEGKTAIDEAIEFLRDELAEGAVDASQVWRDARDTGLSEKTIKRAKARLRVITQRHGETGKRGGGKFTWELPESNLEGQGGHIEKTDPLNYSSLKSDPLPKTDDPLNTPEAVLGMLVEKAIEIWRSEGAPIIHLGPGENCLDLAKLLSNPDASERHLEAVRAWLEKALKQRGES